MSVVSVVLQSTCFVFFPTMGCHGDFLQGNMLEDAAPSRAMAELILKKWELRILTFNWLKSDVMLGKVMKGAGPNKKMNRENQELQPQTTFLIKINVPYPEI